MTDLVKENSPHVGWHSEPSGRGTWGILSSCLITMGLCVVTAIHLNIPASMPNSSSKCHRKRHLLPDFNKLGQWLLMGLFAPELVVYTAWNQFSFVRNITHVMKKRGHEVYPHGEWTVYHSWYFLMGGFAFKTATRNNNTEYIRGSPNLVLSRIGLNYMIEQKIGVLPSLDEDDIRDMGKADSLTKCIVCFQAVYIIAQSVARCAKHYPVSLLELNTVGHCICALMMYLFWFRKPKDVKLQTIIDFKGADDFAAFLYFGGAFAGSICPGAPDALHFLYGRRISEATSKSDEDNFFSATVLLTECQRSAVIMLVRRFGNLIKQIQTSEESLPFVPHKSGDVPFIPPGPRDLLRNADPLRKRQFGQLLDAELMSRRWDRFLENPPPLADNKSAQRQKSSVNISKTLGSARDAFQYALEGPGYDLCKVPTPPINLDDLALRRLTMTLNFLESHLERVKQDFESFIDRGKDEPVQRLFHVCNGVVWEAPNWPTQVGCRGWTIRPQVGVALVTICYGGFHLTALFENSFPTNLERYMWMASCCCLGSTGVVIAVYSLSSEAWRKAYTKKDVSNTSSTSNQPDNVRHIRCVMWIRGFVNAVLSKSPRHFFFPRRIGDEWESHSRPALFVHTLIWIGALLAVASRIFIVVESFASLRSMPPSVYDTPDWPSWIPHL